MIKLFWRVGLAARRLSAPILGREVVYHDGEKVQFLMSYDKDNGAMRREAADSLRKVKEWERSAQG